MLKRDVGEANSESSKETKREGVTALSPSSVNNKYAVISILLQSAARIPESGEGG